jgi:hypothetical protein
LALGGAAVALALGFGAAAQAAVVLGVKTIEVTSQDSSDTVLQVAELRAIEDITGINVALGGTATATQQYDAGTAPGNAIDDVFEKGTYARSYSDTPGLYHGTNTSAVLTVTLASTADLASLELYGRTDGGFGVRDHYRVSLFGVSDNLLFTGTVSAANDQHAGVLQFAQSNTIGGVPEPVSWALMITGFGGVGGLLRTRRRASAVY